MLEKVVLVDEENNILGAMPKEKAHGKVTPLHRAFSCFVFRKSDRKLLLQKRSQAKIAWPGIWSNSCCGHPGLNESNLEAARRRLQDELGLEVEFLEEVAPYRYQFSFQGIMENEICPILVGFTKQEPKINKSEAEAIKWIAWEDFLAKIRKNPKGYSPWCAEEAEILNKNKRFQEIFKKIISH